MAAPFEQMIECKCLVHHFKHISSKLSLMYLVSLETLLDISITCCQTEQCLASQHEPVMTELLVGQPSGRVIKQQYCCLYHCGMFAATKALRAIWFLSVFLFAFPNSSVKICVIQHEGNIISVYW